MVDDGKWQEAHYHNDDIPLVHYWMAHDDAINFVSWVPELEMVASCSFDCKVYVWAEDTTGMRMDKKGSLILGNRAKDPEKADGKDGKDVKKEKRGSKWHITIDKVSRFRSELREAEQLLRTVEGMDYEKMKEIAEIKRKLAEEHDPSMRPLENQLQGEGMTAD